MERASAARYFIRTIALGSALGVLIFVVYIVANVIRAW